MPLKRFATSVLFVALWFYSSSSYSQTLPDYDQERLILDAKCWLARPIIIKTLISYFDWVEQPISRMNKAKLRIELDLLDRFDKDPINASNADREQMQRSVLLPLIFFRERAKKARTLLENMHPQEPALAQTDKVHETASKNIQTAIALSSAYRDMVISSQQFSERGFLLGQDIFSSVGDMANWTFIVDLMGKYIDRLLSCTFELYAIRD